MATLVNVSQVVSCHSVPSMQDCEHTIPDAVNHDTVSSVFGAHRKSSLWVCKAKLGNLLQND